MEFDRKILNLFWNPNIIHYLSQNPANDGVEEDFLFALEHKDGAARENREH